jgi:hypothetical protein
VSVPQAALLMFAAVMLAAPAARAGTDSDTLVEFGLVGSWAADCNAPPSRTNPYQSFVPSPGGPPLRRLSFGDGTNDSTVALRQIALVARDQLAFSFDQHGVIVNIILLKLNARVRPLESATADGRVLVTAGIVKRTGEMTVWLHQCAR